MPYGMLGAVGYGKETTYGTAAFAPGSCPFFLEAMSETFTVAIDWFETRNIIGRLSAPDDEDGLRRIEGDIQFAGFPQPLGWALFNAIGQVTTTSLTALFSHVFIPPETDTGSANPVPSNTLNIYRDVTSQGGSARAQLYTGCLASTLKMNVAPNQDLRCTMTMLGRVSSASGVANTTATFPTSPSGPFTFDTCSLSVGGVGYDLIEGFTWTINNNLEGVGALNNTTYIARARRTDFRRIMVEGTMEFANTQDYDRFLQNTEVAMTASMTKAPSFQIILDTPRVVYKAYPLGMPGKERQTIGFEGEARYLASSATSFRATLTNVTSFY